MTDHVRTSYRNHRRTTWGLVIAVVVASAAVLVPLAAGAGGAGRPATYQFTGSTSVCTGTSSTTFTVKLTNTARTQNLGSADLYAPLNISVANTKLNNVYTDVKITSGAGTTGYVKFVGSVGSGSDARTLISLRALQVPGGQSAQVQITASVKPVPPAPQKNDWYSLAKQANEFNPGDLDTSNAFTIQGDPLVEGHPLYPYFEVSACEYVFVTGPVDAERGAAQTVQVQRQAGGLPVPVSGALTLSALQNGVSSGNFNSPISAANPDADGETWTFSVTGNVSGTGYQLKAGNTISGDVDDPTFSIADGLCQPHITDTENHLTSSCSVTSNLPGPFQSGVTINNHNLAPIAINFAAGNTATGKCDPWIRASYPVNGVPSYFPGVELDFGWGSGTLQVIYRVRNADWVLTESSRGNQDIEICAGARHWQDFENGGDGQKNTDGEIDPFTMKNGDPAVWNLDDQLYWGVLQSVQNPSKVGDDPAVCGRGTTNLATGLNGASETWRTWTICIPFDWDWKNF